MTYPPHSWGNSPPPSHPYPHPPSSSDFGHQPDHGHSLPMMLGRLLERSEHLLLGQGRIEQRLEAGDARFQKHEDRIAKLEQRPEEVSRLERLIKRWAAYLIPAGVLLATGSLETAIKYAQVFKS